MDSLCIAISILCSVAPLLQLKPDERSGHKEGSESLTLRCKVGRIDIEKVTESFTRVNLELTLELINTGKRPIILLGKEPAFPGSYLTSNRGDLARANILNTTYFGPAVDLSPEWHNLREALDQEAPPTSVTRTLMPSDSWVLKTRCYLAFDSSSSTYPKAKSFKEVQEASPVWLQVICNVWPFNVEPMADRKLPFGRELQRRWQRSGHLWLEGLLSEPVLLDLKSQATSK